MSASAEPILVLQDVAKTFMMGEVEVPVLRDIDLEAPGRRLTVILAPETDLADPTRVKERS